MRRALALGLLALAGCGTDELSTAGYTQAATRTCRDAADRLPKETAPSRRAIAATRAAHEAALREVRELTPDPALERPVARALAALDRETRALRALEAAAGSGDPIRLADEAGAVDVHARAVIDGERPLGLDACARIAGPLVDAFVLAAYSRDMRRWLRRLDRRLAETPRALLGVRDPVVLADEIRRLEDLLYDFWIELDSEFLAPRSLKRLHDRMRHTFQVAYFALGDAEDQVINGRSDVTSARRLLRKYDRFRRRFVRERAQLEEGIGAGTAVDPRPQPAS